MVNKKATNKFPETHSNYMGGISYDITNPITRLKVASASCFFGEPMYYQPTEKDQKPARTIARAQSILSYIGYDTKAAYTRNAQVLGAVGPEEWLTQTPAKLLEDAIDKALDYDAEATLKLAVELRNVENIRTTPQIILTRAALHPKVKGTKLISTYGLDILKRPDETTVQLAYLGRESKGKIRKIPTSLKRLWAKFLRNQNAYSLAKYRMENRTVKLVDVVNLSHPVPTPALTQLIEGKLKNTETWEAIVSAEGSNPQTWMKALESMGHMALLRNLRNLVQNNIEASCFIPKLIEGAPTGKQLPFRYYSAYKAMEKGTSPVVLDGIEQAMKASLVNLPKLKGKTISLCDNSGSAKGAITSEFGTVKVNHIANLTGVLTGMISDEGYVGVFGDSLEVVPIMKSGSILQQHEALNERADTIGDGTENGVWIFFRNAIADREHYDNIFIYSDMQAGHGGLYGLEKSEYKDYSWETQGATGKHYDRQFLDVGKLIQKYRKEVNPNVFVFLVQVAGYQDTLVPEYYDRTYILGGWSGSILNFANKMIKMYDAPKENELKLN